jgi:hypothetical protein
MLGAACLHFDYVLWGWLLLAIGTFGFATGVLQVRLEYKQAANLACAPMVLVIVAGLILNLITKIRLSWVLALSWSLIAVLVLLASYGIFSSFRASRARVFVKSLGLIAFAIALVVVFHLFAQSLFPLDALLVFLAADNLRRGLYELFAGQAPTRSDEPALFFLPDIIVLALLIGGLVYYRDLLFFHMLNLTLVLGLFRFSAERFIPEIAARERRKIDEEHPQTPGSPVSFFVSLTGTHSSINLPMLFLLLAYLYLPLDQRIARSSTIHSSVFEVSIGLLGIVLAFSTLILGERLRKGERGRVKQTYLLQGLVGITFLFVIIAVVSFLGLTLEGTTQQAHSLQADDIVTEFLTNSDIQLQVITAMTNEFLFYAIPAALLYFYSLSQDLMERF